MDHKPHFIDRVNERALTPAQEMAATLRQSVRGCATHAHGPLVAWRRVEAAIGRGQVSREDVAAAALGTCTTRIEELRAAVPLDEKAVAAEEATLAFLGRLLGARLGTPGERLLAAVAPARTALLTSPLYERVRTIEGVRVFMAHHAFAVLDFMWLLKSLQRAFTCVDVGWRPTGDALARRLINEIVLGEESDVVDGEALSHFELYLRAMREVGAETGPVLALVGALDDHVDSWRLREVRSLRDIAERALAGCAPPAAGAFMRTTLGFLDRGLHEQVAAFTVGRECLLPAAFGRLLDELPHKGTPMLRAYLHRHVEVDGDDHGPAAMRLLDVACANDPQRWEEATAAAQEALVARRLLWDGIAEAIP